MRYITNYATKEDCDQYQRALAFAIARKALEERLQRQRLSEHPNSADIASNLSGCLVDQDKFALRAFNCISHDCEIIGLLAASTLLKLPEYYTPKGLIVKRILTDSIRRKFPTIAFPGNSDPFQTQHCISRLAKKPVTLFDNYQSRGSQLKEFLLFDYVKLITVVKDKKDTDILFSAEHPYSDSMFQRPLDLELPCCTLVALVGSFSTNESVEDAVINGHIETDAGENDIRLILLALFIPWELLPPRFEAFNAVANNFQDFCWQIWLSFAANLEEYVQFHADNILQMRKSQIECRLDREQRKAAESAAAEASRMDEITNCVDDNENQNVKNHWEDFGHPDWINIVSQAAQIARMQWQGADTLNALKFPVVSHLKHSLQVGDDGANLLVSQKLQDPMGRLCRSLDAAHFAAGITTNIPESTIDHWKAMQKSAKDQRGTTNFDETIFGIELDPHAGASEDSFAAVLEPTTNAAPSLPNNDIFDHHAFFQRNDCVAITDHINRALPLNFLQRLVVEGVMHHVINSKDKPPCVDLDSQMLLYIRGAGGVGKSRVIKAIEMGFLLLQRKEELLIAAPTGAAASGIGGSTVHAAMGIKIPGRNIAASNSNLWTRRTSLIIDEVSMISLKLLSSMDSKIRQAKGSDKTSTALFGGLSLVIFLGDFFQFSPVGGRPLWNERTTLHTESEKRAKGSGKVSPMFSL